MDRAMSQAFFVPGPRTGASLRLFQFVLKAEKISRNFLFQHLFSELNPPFAQLCWTTVSHTNQQQNQYDISAVCELSTLHSKATSDPFIGHTWIYCHLLPLTRSYTTVTNIRTVPVSARLLILCLSNILITWKEPLLHMRKNIISYHTVLVPWSKKISRQKTTAACIQEFDSFSTVGRFVSIDCPLTNKET